MDDDSQKQPSDKSPTEESPAPQETTEPDASPAEEGLIDPRDLVDAAGPTPEVLQPKPLDSSDAAEDDQ